MEQFSLETDLDNQKNKYKTIKMKNKYQNYTTKELREFLDDRYDNLCHNCKDIVGDIVEAELEFESRCNE